VALLLPFPHLLTPPLLPSRTCSTEDTIKEIGKEFGLVYSAESEDKKKMRAAVKAWETAVAECDPTVHALPLVYVAHEVVMDTRKGTGCAHQRSGRASAKKVCECSSVADGGASGGSEKREALLLLREDHRVSPLLSLLLWLARPPKPRRPQGGFGGSPPDSPRFCPLLPQQRRRQCLHLLYSFTPPPARGSAYLLALANPPPSPPSYLQEFWRPLLRSLPEIVKAAPALFIPVTEVVELWGRDRIYSARATGRLLTAVGDERGAVQHTRKKGGKRARVVGEALPLSNTLPPSDLPTSDRKRSRDFSIPAMLKRRKSRGYSESSGEEGGGGRERSERNEGVSFCGGRGLVCEGVVGGRPPEPPPLPARSHMRSDAHTLGRTHTRPHRTCHARSLPP
jgi:hypothetical protein